MKPEETFAGASADAFSRTEGCEDGNNDESHKSESPPDQPVQTRPDEYIPSWKKSPYEDEYIRGLGDKHYGLVHAIERHKEGTFTDEELEAVREFWGTAERQIDAIEDVDEALKTLAFFREESVITDDQLDDLSRRVAHREIQRGIQEQHEQEKAEQEAQESEDAKERERARREALRDRIWNQYQSVHDKLQANDS